VSEASVSQRDRPAADSKPNQRVLSLLLPVIPLLAIGAI